MKFAHEHTHLMDQENWKEFVRPKEMTLDELVTMMYDFKQMESFGKKIAGFLRELVNARMPEGMEEYSGEDFVVTRSLKTRAGNLDVVQITEEMGEEWVAAHRQEPSEYYEIRIAPIKK